MCSSRKYPYMYSSHRWDWNFLGGGGSLRPKHLKKCIKLIWNFQRGGLLEKNPFRGRGMDILWNYTMEKNLLKMISLDEWVEEAAATPDILHFLGQGNFILSGKSLGILKSDVCGDLGWSMYLSWIKSLIQWYFWFCGGLMVSALISGTCGPGSSPGRGHCVVFLGKTLYSHSASLHPGV